MKDFLKKELVILGLLLKSFEIDVKLVNDRIVVVFI